MGSKGSFSSLKRRRGRVSTKYRLRNLEVMAMPTEHLPAKNVTHLPCDNTKDDTVGD
jgi:hypothetical protein